MLTKASKNRLIQFALMISVLFAHAVMAEVSVPLLFSDGLVLQRDQPIRVWGWATSEKQVTVSLGANITVVAPVTDGEWMATLPRQKAGGPYTLTVSGDNRIAIEDVLIGELWFASGQSNMELPMRRLKERYPEEFHAESYPNIREFKVKKEFDYVAPRKDVNSDGWVTASRHNIGQFSGVAYFYAKELHERLDVPVGIILSAFGGASAQGWMSKEALAKYPHYLEKANSLSDTKAVAEMRKRDEAANNAWYHKLGKLESAASTKEWLDPDYNFSDWSVMSIPGMWQGELKDLVGTVWFKKRINVPRFALGRPALLKLGRIVDADTVYVNGVEVGGTGYQYPPRRYSVPADVLRAGENIVTVRVLNNGGEAGFVADNPYLLEISDQRISLEREWFYKVAAKMPPPPSGEFNQFANPLGFFNAMLAPLLATQVRGVIWYQGESNVGAAQEYFQLFPDMIKDWRKQWVQKELPFIFVQLANLNEANSEPVESAWAEAREAQRLTLSLPDTAMAAAFDLGNWNDIHPLNKKDVGYRLSLAARHLVYGENDLVFSGPQPATIKSSRKSIVVKFTHEGGGLLVRGDKLGGFAIAGEDKTFYWAEGKVRGSKVTLKSDHVPNPVFVRYAWSDNPENANLYNEEGLPAVPFEGRAE